MRKWIIGTAALVALLLTGIIGGGYLLTGDGRKNFPADGYVLEVASGEDSRSVSSLTFSAGTAYRAKFPDAYTFRDIEGQKNIVDQDSFLHYSDGSLSALYDGMIVNMDDAGMGFVDFYRLEKGMVMSRASEGWQTDNNGNVLEFPELLWQLTETKVLTASDGMTLTLPGRDDESVSGYLEVNWVDKGIVQVASSDMILQTVAEGGKITFQSGAVLNLGTAAVEDKDGRVLFTLDELMADRESAGLTIQSDSASSWQPPEISITAEDGKEGKDGDVGESGEAGSAGESGEDGEAGESGENGESGTQGNAGSEGGTGEAGASGTKGGTQGSSSSGSTGSATGTDSSLGTIRISSLTYDCSSATVSFAVEDEYATLEADSGTVEIRDAETNRLVAVQTGVNLNGEGELTTLKFSDVLVPDHEYVIVVTNDYTVQQQSGETTTGTKTFVTRHFFTSSEGIVMEEDVVSENTVTVNLNTLEYAQDENIASYRLRITSGEYTAFYPPNGGDDIPDDGTVTLNFGDIFADVTGIDWDSNIPYTIELYTGTVDATSDHWVWDDADEEFEGMKTVNGTTTIRKSTQTLTGTTLKKQPTFGDISYALKDGYYELKLNDVTDEDNSIRSYVFTVKDSEGNAVATLQSNIGTANWYYGDSLPTGIFTVTAEVTYYDNEKDNILTANKATLIANATGDSSLVFYPAVKAKAADGTSYYWASSYDSKNSTSAATKDLGTCDASGGVGASGVTMNSVLGEIVINPNGLTLKDDSEITLTIAASSTDAKGNISYSYKKTVNVPVSEITQETNGCYRYAIKNLGLKADTLYTITATGTVERTYAVGTVGSNTTTNTETLGTASVRTQAVTEESGDYGAAAFSLSDARGAVTDMPDAFIRIYPYDGEQYSRGGTEGTQYPINSPLPGSPYYAERSMARAISFSVYQGQNLIGTVVKDLYPDGYFTEAGGESSFEDAGRTTELESGYFYNSPLVDTDNVWNANNPIYLTTTEMLNAGVDTGNLTGKITVRAEYLYDYAYHLGNDSTVYQGYFQDTSLINYNEMKLKELELKSNAGDAVGLLNSVTIDLGAQPPALITPADSAVEVTQITNSGNTLLSRDLRLQDDTTVGMRVASTYPNNDGMTDTITYYCMLMDDYVAYKTGTHDTVYPLDPVYGATQAGDTDAKILFSIEVKAGSSGMALDGEKVPPVYVMMTEDEELLKKCRTEESDGSITYHVDDSSNTAIFYTDLLERGHCYVFAFTLKSYYGVDTTTGGNPEPWTYPYDIGTHTTTQYGGDMLRSEGIAVYKESPRVAAYLDHTTVAKSGENSENAAYWNYYVYDPDGAMDESALRLNDNTTLPVAYAGSRSDTDSQNELLKGLTKSYGVWTRTDQNLTAELLNCEVESGTKKIYSEEELTNAVNSADATNYNRELAAVLAQEFSVSASLLDTETVSSFTLKVSESDDKKLNSSTNVLNNRYWIWLSSREFVDTYLTDDTTTGTDGMVTGTYLKQRKSDSTGLLDSGEHFVVSTVSHQFDPGVSAEDVAEGLKVEVSILEGGDSLRLIPEDVGSAGVLKHLIGFYYEFWTINTDGASEGSGSDGDGNTEGGSSADNALAVEGNEPVQWGFQAYEGTDSQSQTAILLEKPETYDVVALKLYAVYDTGVSGIDLTEVKSNIHMPLRVTIDNSSQEYPYNTEKVENFYAIQQQAGVSNDSTAMYAKSLKGGSPYTLSYATSADAGAARSLFYLRENTTETVVSRSCVSYNASLYSNVYMTAPLAYVYGSAGAYYNANDRTDIPVMKALAEAKLDSTNKITVASGGVAEKKYVTIGGSTESLVCFQVPAVKPIINSETKDPYGLHSMNLSVTLSEKSIESIVAEESDYDGKIYLELYEGASTTPLENTGNKYFNSIVNTDYYGSSYDGKEFGNRWESYDSEKTNGGNTGNEAKPSATGNVQAYLSPEKGTTKYSIAVRNLTPGTTYRLKLYCKKKDGGTKQYVLNNAVGASVSIGEEYAYEWTARSVINIGSNINEGSLALSAEYVQQSYEKRVLSVAHSLNILRDFQIRYTVTPANGGAITGEADMMKALGYTETAERTFYYYGANGWTTRTYSVYSYTLDGTAYTFSNSSKFEGDFALSDLASGKYTLQVSAEDLYMEKNATPSLWHYQQNTDNVSSGVPSVSFTVAERPAPQVSLYIRQEPGTGSGVGKLTMQLEVTDSGYRLGYYEDENTDPTTGKYRICLYKKADSSQTDWALVNTGFSINFGSVDWDSLLEGGTLYSIASGDNEVKTGECYRLTVEGVDLENLPTDDRKNVVLYDSENVPADSADLVIADLTKPQMSEASFVFNKTARTGTVMVQNGSNLGQIDRVKITLYNTAVSPWTSASATVITKFTETSGSMQSMVIDMSDVIGELSGDTIDEDKRLQGNEMMRITVQFMHETEILTSSSYNFVYM